MRIKSSLFGLLSASILAAALWQVVPRPAEACTAPIPTTLQLASTNVPSDGVLAGIIKDCPGCSADGIRVVDAAGVAVPGTLVALPQALTDLRWFAFRPASPWSVGVRYMVSGPAEGTAPQGSLPFMAVAASAAEPMLVAKLATPQRGVTQERCLQYDSSQLTGFCGTPSFYSSGLVEAQLELRLTQPSATQHAYRVAWSADGQALSETRFPPTQLLVRAFEGAPREVCYELFATPLTPGGTERLVGSECKRTEPDTLGPRSGVIGDMAGTLAYCIVPPEGYEAQWCQTLAPGGLWCRPNGRMSTPCARALTECTNVDAGVSGDAGNPPRSDAAVVSADAEVVGADAALDSTEAGTRADSGALAGDGTSARHDAATSGPDAPEEELGADESGCSMHRGARDGARDGALLVLLSAFLLGWFYSRRR